MASSAIRLSGCPATRRRRSSYAAQHCGSVSLARRSIVRYEAFCVANAHRLRSPDPYQSVSADVIAEFLRDVSASAGHVRGTADAGCSSVPVLDGLALAHTLARAPFPPALLADRRVISGTSSPAPRPAPTSAHMPLAAMLLLEDIALGGYWDEFRASPFPRGAEMRGPFCVHTARSLWVMSVLSFRGVDALRSRVLPIVTEPSPRIRACRLMAPTAQICRGLWCGLRRERPASLVARRRRARLRLSSSSTCSFPSVVSSLAWRGGSVSGRRR